MTSPDCATGSDRCWDLYSSLKNKGEQFDIIVNIQGDEPLVNPEHIDRLVAALVRDRSIKISCATVVVVLCFCNRRR